MNQLKTPQRQETETDLVFFFCKYLQTFWVHISDCSLKSWMSCPAGQRGEGPSRSLSAHSSEPVSVMVRGHASARGIMGNLHICEGTINAGRWIQVLERHVLPSSSVFSKDVLLISARRCRDTFCTCQNSVASQLKSAGTGPACLPECC